MPVIPPTIGRVVLYFPSDDDIYYSRIDGEKGKPLAATVAWINDDPDRTVNLGVLDMNGISIGVNHVRLIQEGEPIPDRKRHAYCTWMPYQLGQAAKTEAAEAKIKNQP